jgi:hypothetical protein
MTTEYFQMIVFRILDLISTTESEEHKRGLKDALKIIKEETGSR